MKGVTPASSLEFAAKTGGDPSIRAGPGKEEPLGLGGRKVMRIAEPGRWIMCIKD